MRGFIKICGALFVIVGMIGFAIAVFAMIVGLNTNNGTGGIVLGLATILGSAGVTMVGGVAYMLCTIDHRLEWIASRAGNWTVGTPTGSQPLEM
jgi:hypothetical protein